MSDLVERIEGNGGRTLSVSCNVTDEGHAHTLIRRAEEEFGRVDILVNNAGVMLFSKVEKGLSLISGARCSTLTCRVRGHKRLGFCILLAGDRQQGGRIRDVGQA